MSPTTAEFTSACISRRGPATYQWLREAVRIHLKLLQRLLLGRRALHDLARAISSQVFQNRLNLVACGWLFLGLEGELGLLGFGLRGVVGRLVNRRGGAGIGLSLLEQVEHAHG